MTTARGLALASTVRVVDGVHGDAAGLRAHALPAVAAGLTDLHQFGLGVADLADGAAAIDRDAAHLGARQAQGGEVALLGHELHARARTASDLAAAAGLQLDVVHGRSDGDVPQGQRVPGPDLGTVATLHHVADLHRVRGEDVRL